MNRSVIAGTLLGATGLGIAALNIGAAEPIRCAWVDSTDDSIVNFQTFDAVCPPDRLHKNIKWLPAPPVQRAPHDPATEHSPVVSHTVTPTEVTESWNVTAKSAQEIDNDKTNAVNRIDVAIFESLCHLKNQIRTKVDGLTAWSKAQCRDAFKALMP